MQLSPRHPPWHRISMATTETSGMPSLQLCHAFWSKSFRFSTQALSRTGVPLAARDGIPAASWDRQYVWHLPPWPLVPSARKAVAVPQTIAFRLTFLSYRV